MEAQTSPVIDIQKEFNVSKDRLFQAWNNQEDLKQWWKPMNSHLQHVVNDLKQGGEIRYEFQKSDGTAAFTVSGNYEQVSGQDRLVYSWNWQLPEPSVEDGQFKLTVLFESTGNGSLLKVTQENFKNEESVMPHRQGWEKGLNDLFQFLAGSQPNAGENPSDDSQNTQGKPGIENDKEVTGYNEIAEQEKVGGYQ